MGISERIRERREATQKALHAKMRQDLMDKQAALIQSGQFDRTRDVLVKFESRYNHDDFRIR